MRVHAIAALCVLLAALLLEITPAEFVALALVSGMVIVAELANTALEALIDLVTARRNHLAEVSKNAAAGAVLVTAMVAFLVGVTVFLPYALDPNATFRMLLQKPCQCVAGTLAILLVVLFSVMVPLKNR